jgi:AcrR family transcriptional regulator
MRLTAERLEERREQILDAALRCFARNGFHHTTMADIAREAGLSVGASYRYFESKDDVIEAMAEERHAREASRTATAFEGEPAAPSLRALARGYLGMLAEPGELERRRLGVQVWAEALRSPRIHELVLRGIHGPMAAFAELLVEARARGEVPQALDPETGARMMVALFQGFILQQAWDEQADPEAYLKGVEVVIDALVRSADAG